MFSGNAPRPLEGVNVLELATFVAVPAAGRFLADMGANVIKVEAPKGDSERWVGNSEQRPDDDPLENTTFDLENSGKRSLSINLKTDEGRTILFKLLDRAAIFTTNWRPQALARMGLGYNDLKAKYPALVYASFTGYGEEGPDKDLPGFDFTAFFARGGLIASLSDKDGGPFNVIPGLGDHQAAYMFVAGILAAYVRALTTGQGDHVSVSLLHAAIFTQAIMVQSSQYPEIGHPYPIARREHDNPLTGAYETSDGRYIFITNPLHEKAYPAIMAAIGRPDLSDHPVYGHLDSLIAQGRSPELFDILSEQFKKKTLAEWLPILSSIDIPAGACQLWEELFDDPQAKANRIFYESLHANGNTTIQVRTPVNLEETPEPTGAIAPLLGENSREIVRGLGYTEEQVQGMLDRKVIREWHLGENPNIF